MFKYYLSKDYRRVHDELDKLGLLSDSLAVRYADYETYAQELILSSTPLTRHLQILSADRQTPIRIIKALLLLHAWLQAAPAFDDVQPFYAYMDHLIRSSSELAVKAKSDRTSFERKRAKSAIFKGDMSGEEIEVTKEVFLLEKVVKPYVLYLQKLVSVFPFYSGLKKALHRPLAPPEIWILLNLFKCGYAVTMQLPTICKFIRKSFTPLAEALAEAFSSDFTHFYPKLAHHARDQCLKVEARFDELLGRMGEAEAYRANIEGLSDAVNLLQEMGQLNKELECVYNEPSLRSRISVYRPKLLSLNDEVYEFVIHIHHAKTNNLYGEQTPKFYRSRPSEQTENDKGEPRDEMVPVFRDVTNEDDKEDNACTFRKDKQPSHLVPRYRKRQEASENEP